MTVSSMQRIRISAPSGFRQCKKSVSSPEWISQTRPTGAVEYFITGDVPVLHGVFPIDTRASGRSPMRIAGGFHDIGLDIPVKNQ
jgi:hypothetical protein